MGHVGPAVPKVSYVPVVGASKSAQQVHPISASEAVSTFNIAINIVDAVDVRAAQIKHAEMVCVCVQRDGSNAVESASILQHTLFIVEHAVANALKEKSVVKAAV